MDGESAQALHDLLDGRHPIGPLPDDVRVLARLARDCQRIQVPGPAVAALSRIETRLDRFVLGADRLGRLRPLRGEAWGSPLSRFLANRLAVAGLLISALGTGGAAAAGIGPLDVAKGIVRLGGSIAMNLVPADEGAGLQEPVEEVTIEAPLPPAPQTRMADDEAQGAAPLSPSPVTPAGGTEAPAAGAPAAQSGSDPGTPAQPVAGDLATPAPPPPPPTATPAVETPAATPSAIEGESTAAAPGDDSGASPGGAEALGTPAPEVTPSPSPAPSPSPSPTPGQSGATGTYAAGPAGFVVLRHSSSGIELVEVTPAPGWDYAIEGASETFIKISFAHEDGEVEFEATIVDEEVVTIVRGPEDEPGEAGDGDEDEHE